MKKIELGASKNSKSLDFAKQQVKDMQLIITKLENENSHLHKKVQDISIKNDEKDREISE